MSGDSRTVAGWLVRDKGFVYLGTSAGWWRLQGVGDRVGRPGLEPEAAVVVEGRECGRAVLQVEDIRGAPGGDAGLRVRRRPGDPAGRPAFIGRPVPQIHDASRLRFEAHAWLRDHGFDEVTLPVLWPGPPAPDGDRPWLLRTPDVAVQAALAGGVYRFFSFARCLSGGSGLGEGERFPGGDGPPGGELAEREQLVAAGAFAGVDEMTALVSRLVVRLAGCAGVALEDGDVVVAPEGVEPPGAPDLLFSVPATWPAPAGLLLAEHLAGLGATVDRAGSPGRFVIRPGPDRVGVARIVDVAASLALAAGGNSALQWNPTWFPGPGGSSSVLYLRDREVATVGEVRAPRPAPPAGVAVVHWEELLAVLVGAQHARELQLFGSGRAAAR